MSSAIAYTSRTDFSVQVACILSGASYLRTGDTVVGIQEREIGAPYPTEHILQLPTTYNVTPTRLCDKPAHLRGTEKETDLAGGSLTTSPRFNRFLCSLQMMRQRFI